MDWIEYDGKCSMQRYNIKLEDGTVIEKCWPIVGGFSGPLTKKGTISPLHLISGEQVDMVMPLGREIKPQPEPVADEKYDNFDVYGIVDNEGLDYAITTYMDGESIKDEKLAKMWNEAAKLLREIEEYLEPYSRSPDNSVRGVI